jgi:signal peptidase I
VSAASANADAAPGAPSAGPAGGASAGTPARRRRPSGIVVAVGLIAALVLVRAFVAEPFRIPSQSMEPTLKPGDQALVEKLSGHSPKRGDLVAFHSPRNGDILLKRVVAVGGDSVGLEDGVLVVDGRPVNEPFVDHEAIDSVYFGPVRVRPATVFVMGDNRANSEDSRDFGAVRTSSIIGRAVARVWPPGRWGTTP